MAKKPKKKKEKLKMVAVAVKVTDGETKKTEKNMASWNNLKFQVTAKEATALSALDIKDSYNDDYNEKGKRIGRELTTFNVTATYVRQVAGSWGNAREAMQKWRNQIGKSAYFYLWGRKLFKRKCILLGVNSNNFLLTNKGQVLAVEVQLEFRWARTPEEEKEAIKAAKSGATKSSGKKVSGKNVINIKKGPGGTYNGGKMAWPLPGHKTISSNYGYRIRPNYGTRQFHGGIDIPAPYGTSILAAAAGTVVLAGYNGSYGNCIIISHGKSIWTLYGHQSSLLVKNGQRVSAKQKIGKVGSTGNSTGNHLHFEVRKGANSSSSHTSPWNYVSR